MNRHLGHITVKEAQSLEAVVEEWLDVHEFIGAVRQEYSLYRAIDEAIAEARLALVASAKKPESSQ